MCLVIDEEKTKKIKRLLKIRPDKKLIFYKVFEKSSTEVSMSYIPVDCTNFYHTDTNSLTTLYRRNRIYNFGTVESEGPIQYKEARTVPKLYGVVYGGVCHAFVTTKVGYYLERDFGKDWRELVTIPITVYLKDIFAYGMNNDVCFFKYRIEESTWKKIFKIGER